jgi:hypothetical protein
MPRQMRREFAGAIYHVMNRGDRREEIFRTERELADSGRFRLNPSRASRPSTESLILRSFPSI